MHDESQECKSVVTPDSVFTLTCVLHGTTNADTYLQSRIVSILTDNLCPQVLFWLYDILLTYQAVEGFIGAIGLLLNIFKDKNIKEQQEKCSFFSTSIRWCGRVLCKDGILFDPHRMDGIIQMVQPTTGAHLK